MPKFETIKVGDVLWSCHKQQQGNTTIRKMVCFRVVITELLSNGAMASWNNNTPRFYSRGQLEKLRRSPIKDASR